MAKIKHNGELQQLSLSLLHLDKANPRFGGREDRKREESGVLAEIVGQHGITDVISSIAANGFFESEPLVGAINKGYDGEVTIVEGNRRLSACLILAGDPRAAAFSAMAGRYESDKMTSSTKIPVQVYDWADDSHRRKLLPYFGVRHIVGASEWDSYAKAAWVASTLKDNAMTLEEIRSMIGDDQKFTDRILEGYNVVQQIDRTGAYEASESKRSGRGSFQDFPFSWVYTALGYTKVREFLGLPKEMQIDADPLGDEGLPAAGELLQFMFGGEGKNAAIEDSRQIGKLSKALTNEKSITALRQGQSAEEALQLLEPADKRCVEFLRNADAALESAVAIASGLKRMDSHSLNLLENELENVGVRYDNFVDLIEKLKTNRPPKRRRKGQ